MRGAQEENDSNWKLTDFERITLAATIRNHANESTNQDRRIPELFEIFREKYRTPGLLGSATDERVREREVVQPLEDRWRPGYHRGRD